MTDVEKLKNKIKESGLKMEFIAKSVGISRQQLWKKINGASTFNQFEIEAMCNVLGITSLREKNDIFFAKV